MTSHEAIPSSRSELKFEIDEAQTPAIRQYLRAHLRPDPNCWDGPYLVCSAYLDSQDCLLYEQTNQGIRNRYKLRVRVYNDDASNPAFLEIKGRDGSAIKKQRARVDRRVAATVLSGAGASITQSTYEPTDRSDWLAFHEFCRLRDRIGAVGTTYVRYLREAFVSPNGTGCRATFDRELMTCPYRPARELALPDQWINAEPSNRVIFELKFSGDFPNWMAELVRTFNLEAGPFPKYVKCRDSLHASETTTPNPLANDSMGAFASSALPHHDGHETGAAGRRR